ncbi:MAG TPA: hypothetical protein VEC94_17215 [Pseudolabrys sp.]|nr:hypothetical protein [Pseudolabrys sp.]
MENRKAIAQTVAVTMRSLVKRINRKIATDREILKVSRDATLQRQLGEFYVLELRFNGVVRKDVDPEEFGRELGVLQPWEGLKH